MRNKRMLEANLDRLTAAIKDVEDEVDLLARNEQAKTYQIKRAIDLLRANKTPLNEASLGRGSHIWRLASELSDTKLQIQQRTQKIDALRSDRMKASRLLDAADNRAHVKFQQDLERHGLTLERVTQDGEEVQLALDTTSDIAAAAAQPTVAPAADLSVLIAQLVNNTEPPSLAVPRSTTSYADTLTGHGDSRALLLPSAPSHHLEDDSDGRGGGSGGDDAASASVVLASGGNGASVTRLVLTSLGH
jgi:hypothetical protein